ncbi:MAG: Periplasmic zinc-binding protein TroA [Chlamydiae bacterium]|nr:Periplasmic zinc-binding protein TroA [Chlamydiota bacterium]
MQAGNLPIFSAENVGVRVKKGLVFCILLLLVVGCSKSPGISMWKEGEKIRVLSTTAMIDDLVAKIGGDFVDSIPLITGEIDPHSYELVKGDDEKISSAQIVIANGLNLEHGASLNYQLKKHLHSLYLAEEIRKRVPEKILVTEGEVDPHVWMDISLWAEGIEPIVHILSVIDPENAPIYEANGAILYQKMLLEHEQLKESMQSVPANRRYLVTSHDAFHYFAKAYLAEGKIWEDRCVAPEGLAPEGQLSSRDIQRVIDHLCEYEISVVFPESNVSRDALRKIVASCKTKGLVVRISSTPLYGDAMGSPGSGADHYLGMIAHNAKVLEQEWMQ